MEYSKDDKLNEIFSGISLISYSRQIEEEFYDSLYNLRLKGLPYFLNFLQANKSLIVKDFYEDDETKSIRPDYFNKTLVIEKEELFLIHIDFKSILFYFVLDSIRKDLIKFKDNVINFDRNTKYDKKSNTLYYSYHSISDTELELFKGFEFHRTTISVIKQGFWLRRQIGCGYEINIQALDWHLQDSKDKYNYMNLHLD